MAEWLRDKVGDVEVSQLAIPAGTGYSNETLLFDAGDAGYVLRVKPTGYQLFLETDFERQFDVMKLVSETTDVPMPTMLWFEEDASWLGAPFFVMSKVAGVIPSDDPCYNTAGFLFDASVEERRRLWSSAMDAFTGLHRQVSVDAARFLDKPERGATGFDQQHLDGWVARQAVGQHAAGRAGAHDDVVIVPCGFHAITPGRRALNQETHRPRGTPWPPSHRDSVESAYQRMPSMLQKCFLGRSLIRCG